MSLVVALQILQALIAVAPQIAAEVQLIVALINNGTTPPTPEQMVLARALLNQAWDKLEADIKSKGIEA